MVRYRSQLLLLAWPGLPHLWLRGSWAGLVLAAGFTGLVCVLLAGGLAWTEWTAPAVQSAGLCLAAAIWVGSVVVSLRGDIWVGQGKSVNHPSQPAPLPNETVAASPHRDLFPRAQGQYLKGDWLATEQTLHRLLSKNRRDVEARLLLATLCRQMNRLEEASVQLAMLERLEAAERWGFEMTVERRRLDAARGVDDPQESSENERVTQLFPHEENHPIPNEQKATATDVVFGAETDAHAETIGTTDAAMGMDRSRARNQKASRCTETTGKIDAA